ncbi:glutamine-hydrolyzing carbamoyl-phosphate synthase small subunit [Bdellovibrionota bacterium FG-1]
MTAVAPFCPGILILEDGSSFEGLMFGAATASNIRDRGYGEVVFNTSMTGYQEILTDPSYYGQIVCMTASHVGNTGVNAQDAESAHPWCAGFVIQENSETSQHWRSESDLHSYLIKQGIPGLMNVDTRALTQHLRSQGALRGMILPIQERDKAKELFAELPLFEGRDLIDEVTTQKPYFWSSISKTHPQPTATGKRYKVVALDLGIKWNLLRSLEVLGCDIEVVPAKTSAQEILARHPDGVFLSNGPGDPSAALYVAETVRAVLGKVALFGVCMGHQILALALGAKTYKLKFGHRGGNQPVVNQDTRRVEISSHNHGYAVDALSLPANTEITHINLNDKTVEGLRVSGQRAFSVQYHPEACPGPHDSVALFDQFVAEMQKGRL